MIPTRCSPVQMRKSAGMEFVPIPVLGDGGREKLNAILAGRLESLASAAEGSAP